MSQRTPRSRSWAAKSAPARLGWRAKRQLRQRFDTLLFQAILCHMIIARETVRKLLLNASVATTPKRLQCACSFRRDRRLRVSCG